MRFEKTNIRSVQQNAVKMIADDWALVTAGDASGYNTMTVSWGGIGELWGKDAAFIFIRPQRHTLRFVEANDRFTVSFFGGAYKKELLFCGRNSGRDVDKAKQTGLVPVFEDDVTYFEQAALVLKCRKMAKYDLSPEGFIDKSVQSNYSSGDYHKMFIAEIEEVLVRRE